MSRNKNWKRKAKRIIGQSINGCSKCKFHWLDPEGFENDCELCYWIDDDECCDLRKLRVAVKGKYLEYAWDEKMKVSEKCIDWNCKSCPWNLTDEQCSEASDGEYIRWINGLRMIGLLEE